MLDALLLCGVLAAGYLGFMLLALSQNRHWQGAGGHRRCPARTSWLLRGAGCVLLIGALLLALLRDGAGFGPVLWATTISVSAFAVVGTLTWRSDWLRPIVRLLEHRGRRGATPR